MIYGYIYGLRCKINGKWYIGQTTKEPLTYIIREYKYLQGANRTKIKRALKKYGFNNFDICLLDSSSNKEDLDVREQNYIIEYNSMENGYNLMSGGSHGKHSIETKQLISEKNKGNKAWLGKKHSKETKDKLSLSASKRTYHPLEKMTDEDYWKYIQYLKESRTGDKNPMFGKEVTEETKNKLRRTWNLKTIEEKQAINEKISNSTTGNKNHSFGKPKSEKTKKLISDKAKKRGDVRQFMSHEAILEMNRKISEATKGEKHRNYGKHLSVEHRRKISEATKGEKHRNYKKELSKETKIKISDTLKKTSFFIGKPSWNSGKPMSDEIKEKIRNKLKGRKFSEETRKKFSEKAKQRELKKRLLKENSQKDTLENQTSEEK